MSKISQSSMTKLLALALFNNYNDDYFINNRNEKRMMTYDEVLKSDNSTTMMWSLTAGGEQSVILATVSSGKDFRTDTESSYYIDVKRFDDCSQILHDYIDLNKPIDEILGKLQTVFQLVTNAAESSFFNLINEVISLFPYKTETRHVYIHQLDINLDKLNQNREEACVKINFTIYDSNHPIYRQGISYNWVTLDVEIPLHHLENKQNKMNMEITRWTKPQHEGLQETIYLIKNAHPGNFDVSNVLKVII